MKLVIVESPAKIKTISKYLDNSFIIFSSMGHVRALPSKDGSVLVDQDFKMIYTETPNAKKSGLYNIKASIDNVDIIYLATDMDREGEAIAWHVVTLLKDKKIISN